MVQKKVHILHLLMNLNRQLWIIVLLKMLENKGFMNDYELT